MDDLLIYIDQVNPMIDQIESVIESYDFMEYDGHSFVQEVSNNTYIPIMNEKFGVIKALGRFISETFQKILIMLSKLNVKHTYKTIIKRYKTQFEEKGVLSQGSEKEINDAIASFEKAITTMTKFIDAAKNLDEYTISVKIAGMLKELEKVIAAENNEKAQGVKKNDEFEFASFEPNYMIPFDLFQRYFEKMFSLFDIMKEYANYMQRFSYTIGMRLEGSEPNDAEKITIQAIKEMTIRFLKFTRVMVKRPLPWLKYLKNDYKKDENGVTEYYADHLLESVDMIQETVTNSEIEVFNALSETYSKCALMMENNNYEINDILCIQEATNIDDKPTSNPPGTNNNADQQKKPGVFRQIINAIIKFFKFIGRQIARFVRFIASLFKRKTKTADQIAEEVGIQPNKSVAKSSSTGSKSAVSQAVSSSGSTTAKPPKKKRNFVKAGRKRYSPKIDKSVGEVVKTVTIPLEVETGKGSVVDQSIDVDVIMKKLRIKLNQDGTFSMDAPQGVENAWRITNRDDHIQDNHKVKMNEAQNPYLAVQALLGDGGTYFSNLMNAADKLFESIRRTNNGVNDAATELEAMLDKNYRPKWNFNTNDRFKYSDIIELQKKVSEFTTKLERFKEYQFPDTDVWYRYGSLYKRVVGVLNQLTVKVNDVQMSLNTLTKCFMIVYDLDAEYEGCVSDIETLTKFVDGCIKSGMPAKNVIINTYLITTPELHGETITMKNGNSRAVMFPENEPNIVYKVALSGFGLAANRAERRISILAEKQEFNELMDLIAPTNREITTDTVISQERAVPTTEEERKANLRQYLVKLIGFLNDHKDFPYNIGDIHDDNIGKRKDGTWIAVDYGMTARRAPLI